MNRCYHLYALLAATVLTWPAIAAMSVADASPTGVSILLIDGVACDRVQNWEGGDLRGSVATTALPGESPTKSVANVRNAPLQMSVALPLSPQLTTLINDLCAARFTRHKLLLVDYNSTGVAAAAFELNNALLSGVTFPAFDATTTTMQPVKLMFDVEQSATVDVPSVSPPSSAAQNVSTFRLTIDGVDSSKTLRIEPITIALQASPTATGENRLSTSTPAGVEFTNLRVTFSASSAPTWKAWWTEFVVNGKVTDTSEKSGAIELIGSSGAPLPIALRFDRLGILRVSRPAATSGLATKLEAELYFEGFALSGPAAPDAKNTSSTSNESTPEQTASTSSTETAKPDPASTADTTSAPQDVTSVSSSPLQVQPASRTIMTTEVPLATSTSPLTTARIAPLTTNPDDTGTRDPAEFPRVDGIRRTYYSGTFQPGYTSETATYTFPAAMGQLVPRVEAAAKAAGWTMTSVTESAPNTGRSVAESWVKGGASVSVSFFQPNNTTTTQYNLQVYVKLDAPN